MDCTVGLGGHAEAFLERFPGLRIAAVDRDPEALARSAERLAPWADRVTWVEGNFHRFRELLAGHGLQQPQGVLADLGVSSMQLDLPERGFSFRFDGPLDMRMGADGETAADIVNSYSEADLERIFREYGEERQARRVAREIVAERASSPILTTTDLRSVVAKAKGGYSGREGRVDVATRTFQALRIEVNQELAGLDRFLEEAMESLEEEGRLVIISYHSLEDRIVKHTLRHLARGEVDPITGRPLSERRLIEILTRKPVRPGGAELAANPRSRSARLRAAKRL